MPLCGTTSLLTGEEQLQTVTLLASAESGFTAANVIMCVSEQMSQLKRPDGEDGGKRTGNLQLLLFQHLPVLWEQQRRLPALQTGALLQTGQLLRSGKPGKPGTNHPNIISASTRHEVHQCDSLNSNLHLCSTELWCRWQQEAQIFQVQTSNE